MEKNYIVTVLSKTPKKLSKKSFFVKCRELIRSNSISFTGHFKKRLLEKELSIQDILNVFTSVKNRQFEPRWNSICRCWSYVITTKNVDCIEFSLVAQIQDYDGKEVLVFITVY